LPLLLVLFRKEAQESLPRCSGGIGLAPGKAALILSACRAGDAVGPMADYLLNALVTLFVTVDPAGLGPIFLALTAGLSKAERHQVALRACATATAVLVAFALLGQELLAALGITLAAFRIAGGLLLFWIAFEMVFERRVERKSQTAERALTRPEIRHVAVFPLAVPLMSGPGAISATILLAANAPSRFATVLLIASILAMVAACYAVFRLAGPLDRLLGETGRIVLGRLLGLILSALAVQFVADGVRELLTG